jgi:5'-deoxynucleotidase YfbR-like HD superfamily hydrolase
MRAMSRADVMHSWYLASLVERYHTWPTIRTETVAEHSHGVAMLYVRLFASDPDDVLRNGAAHLRATRWILENDLAELWSGDAPFPVKVRFPHMKAAHTEVEREANVALGVRVPEFTEETVARIKACDLLQMHLFGLHEVRMGNSYARPIMHDSMTEALRVVQGDKTATDIIVKFLTEEIGSDKFRE